jgi:HD-like signal output (HDOD) protein
MITTETAALGIVASEICGALEDNRLELPALPDMLIKVRNSLESPTASLEGLVQIVSTDPVVAAHVIRAANSSAFHGAGRVNNLRSAISRIGYRMLYGIVTNLALTQLFRAPRPFIDRQLRRTWQHSCEVAANCYVLAEHESHLRPEVALLAGLVHRIGVLPLCLYAEKLLVGLDESMLDDLVRDHAADISPRVLRHWAFADELVDIVAGYGDPACISHPDVADYVDVLILSERQALSQSNADAWRNLHSAERLGFYPGDCVSFFSAQVEKIAEMQGVLGIKPGRPS